MAGAEKPSYAYITSRLERASLLSGEELYELEADIEAYRSMAKNARQCEDATHMLGRVSFEFDMRSGWDNPATVAAVEQDLKAELEAFEQGAVLRTE